MFNFKRKVKTYQDNQAVIYLLDDSLFIELKNSYTLILTIEHVRIMDGDEEIFGFENFIEVSGAYQAILNNKHNANISDYQVILNYFSKWLILKYDVNTLKSIVNYIKTLGDGSVSKGISNNEYPAYWTRYDSLFSGVPTDACSIYTGGRHTSNFHLFRGKIYLDQHAEHKAGNILHLLERFLRIYHFKSINNDILYYIRGYEGSLLTYYDDSIESFKILQSTTNRISFVMDFKEFLIDKNDINKHILSFCVNEINHNDDMKDLILYELSKVGFDFYNSETIFTVDDLVMLDMITY